MSKHEERMRRRRLLPLLAIVAAVGLLIAGCGDDDDDDGGESGDTSSDPIKVGFLSTCEGAFGAFYEATAGGFNVPLINRGAEATSEVPTDGIEGAEIAGQPVEIVGYGCSDETPDMAVQETRRLMEQEDADILIGPLSGDEGIAVGELRQGAPGQDVHQRCLRCTGHDAEGAGAELLPLPHRRRAVVGRRWATTPTTSSVGGRPR